VKFTFIAAKRADFPVAWMCCRIEVSTSGFYRWSKATESSRTKRHRRLGTVMRALHAKNRGVYGSPRMLRALTAAGEAIGRQQVATIMREHGLVGRAPRPFRRTTDSKHSLPIAPNLVARDFNPAAKNQVWVADITYVRTWAGWLYLAVIIDLFSRRVVGWAIADHMRTELVLSALSMAFLARRPGPGLIFHSDRGSQYASRAHRAALDAHGAVCSMSRKGDCWDNAVAESFFGSLKQELLYRSTWATHDATIDAIGDYIERFYNTRRLHSFIGYTSPLEYELQTAQWRSAA
jgi:transposase InsO family protein